MEVAALLELVADATVALKHEDLETHSASSVAHNSILYMAQTGKRTTYTCRLVESTNCISLSFRGV